MPKPRMMLTQHSTQPMQMPKAVTDGQLLQLLL